MFKLLNPIWLIQNFLTMYWIFPDTPPAAPTTTTVQNTNLPDYAQPYVESMMGAAQKQVFNMNPNGTVGSFKQYNPYSKNMNDYVAGFSPLQQKSFQGANNLQLPGQYGQAAGYANQAGLGSLGVANQAGQMGQAGSNYFGMATNPGSVGQFMNPYLQQSLAPQLDEMRRQYGITGTQEQSAATGAGAFGGSREALMAAENNRNMNTAMNQTIGQGYNNAYGQAIQNMQYGSNLGLQGQQAAAQAALQGYGQANTAANTLGQLGQQQLTGQEGILGLQNQYGGQQQQAEQTKINQAIQNYATAQQYPWMQLGNMSNVIHGLPMQSSTVQSYQAQPGIASQLAGLGAGAYGVSKMVGAKRGGSTKDIRKHGDGIDAVAYHQVMNYKE